MTIYIDKDYCCHAEAAEGLRAFDVPDLDGKCPAVIESYRYVPEGETWTRPDGVEFTGEMITPAVDSRILEAYQQQYEAMLPEMTDMQTALETLGVNANG